MTCQAHVRCFAFQLYEWLEDLNGLGPWLLKFRTLGSHFTSFVFTLFQNTRLSPTSAVQLRWTHHKKDCRYRQSVMTLKAVNLGEPLFACQGFQLQDGHLVGGFYGNIPLEVALPVFPALYSPRDRYLCSHGKVACVARVSSPGDAWYVIGFVIHPVHCEHDIADFPSQR